VFMVVLIDADVVDVFSLHPGDLYPFTRKPLFIIIDSDNSSAFEVRRVADPGLFIWK